MRLHTSHPPTPPPRISHSRQVTLYFREPVQLSRIDIREIANPAIAQVRGAATAGLGSAPHAAGSPCGQWRHQRVALDREVDGAGLAGAKHLDAAPFPSPVLSFPTTHARTDLHRPAPACTRPHLPVLTQLQLLPWPAVAFGPDLPARRGVLGRPLNVPAAAAASTACPRTTSVVLPAKRAGMSIKVSSAGSQEELPRALRGTAVGGVTLLLKAPVTAGDVGRTWVESVRFTGRVLYPRDAAAYAAVKAPSGAG